MFAHFPCVPTVLSVVEVFWQLEYIFRGYLWLPVWLGVILTGYVIFGVRMHSTLIVWLQSKLLRVKQSQHCGSGFGSSEDPRTAMSIGSVSSHVRQEQRLVN